MTHNTCLIHTASRSTSRITSWLPATTCVRFHPPCWWGRTTPRWEYFGLDSRRRSITRTSSSVTNPNDGCQVDSGDIRHRAFTAGMNDNHLYLVDTQTGTARAVFDFSPYACRRYRIRRSGRSCCWSTRQELAFLSRSTLRGRQQGGDARHRGSGTSQPVGADPEAGVVDLGLNSGPHYLRLTSDERRIIVSITFSSKISSPVA